MKMLIIAVFATVSFFTPLVPKVKNIASSLVTPNPSPDFDYLIGKRKMKNVQVRVFMAVKKQEAQQKLIAKENLRDNNEEAQ